MSYNNDQDYIVESKSEMLVRPQVSTDIKTSASIGVGPFIKTEQAIAIQDRKEVPITEESVELSTTDIETLVLTPESEAEAEAEAEVEAPATRAVAARPIKATESKAKKSSSFWKRWRKTKKSKGASTQGKSKQSTAGKFKMTSLFPFGRRVPSKKMAAIKETEETPPVQPKQASVSSEQEQVESEPSWLRTIEVIDSTINSRDDLIADQIIPMVPMLLAADLVENKEDIEKQSGTSTAADPNILSKSWLSEAQSQDETFTETLRTLSYMSTFGDTSKTTVSAAAPAGDGMMSGLSSFFSDAKKAAQHNLCDAPVREFEKLRDFACGTTAQAEAPATRVLPALAEEVPEAAKQEATATNNPFANAFNELVEVLELGSGSGKTQSTA